MRWGCEWPQQSSSDRSKRPPEWTKKEAQKLNIDLNKSLCPHKLKCWASLQGRLYTDSWCQVLTLLSQLGSNLNYWIDLTSQVMGYNASMKNSDPNRWWKSPMFSELYYTIFNVSIKDSNHISWKLKCPLKPVHTNMTMLMAILTHVQEE